MCPFNWLSRHCQYKYICLFNGVQHQIRNQINTTGATSGAGTAYPSGAPEFTPGFQWGSCYSIFSFICMFCRSLFVPLYFFFWPLCCLFYFDIRFLIAPLVSSNSSFNTISVISQRSALLVEETGGPRDNINTLFYDNSNISDTNNDNNFLIVQDFIL